MLQAEIIERIMTQHPWTASWYRNGMICALDASRPKGAQAFEVKGGVWPSRVDALGCGGWNASGELSWVGIDLDVGHGTPKNQYATIFEAVDAARSIRRFVGGAAEIRTSKSGNGLHVRISISDGITDGRNKARMIAKWIVRTLAIKADPSVLGRQNLWFWTATASEGSFDLVEPCEGRWTPPPAAMQEEQPPVAVTVPAYRTTDDRLHIMDRAAKYLAKAEISVSGNGGHDRAYRAACILTHGFALSIDEARPLLAEWNQGCQPPWSQSELEHKLTDSARASGPRGQLLAKTAVLRPIPAPVDASNSEPVQRQPQGVLKQPSELLRERVLQECNGGRYLAEFGPWPMISHLSRILMPGAMGILCAPPGRGKSFFSMQACAHWQAKGYPWRIFELEEDLIFHLRRGLGQHLGNQSISDIEWCAANPDEAERICIDNADWMDIFGAKIDEAPHVTNADTIIGWVDRHAPDNRVMVIDPITAKDPSGKDVWNDDLRIVRECNRIITKTGSSLLLVTHPPKGPDTARVAGGAAYDRFAQSILHLDVVEEPPLEEKFLNCTSCKQLNGEIIKKRVNRKLTIEKARNGRGAGVKIGMYFDPMTLKFEECGQLDKDS